MSVQIDHWIGRMGNWITQIANALSVAHQHKTVLKFPNKEPIKGCNISFGEDTNYTASGDYFYYELGHEFYRWPNLSEKSRQYAIDNRWRLTKQYSSSFLPSEPRDVPYDLTFHFRGGDIWGNDRERPRVPALYIQSPISYYDFIIEKENPNSILFIAQDDANIIREKLYKKYNKHIEIKQSVADSLTNDISKMLNSKIVVAGGFGTFVPSLAGCSNKIQKMYYPCFYDDVIKQKDDHKNIAPILSLLQIDDYIKGWSLSPETLDKVESHDINNISEQIIESK